MITSLDSLCALIIVKPVSAARFFGFVFVVNDSLSCITLRLLKSFLLYKEEDLEPEGSGVQIILHPA